MTQAEIEWLSGLLAGIEYAAGHELPLPTHNDTLYVHCKDSEEFRRHVIKLGACIRSETNKYVNAHLTFGKVRLEVTVEKKYWDGKWPEDVGVLASFKNQFAAVRRFIDKGEA